METNASVPYKLEHRTRTPKARAHPCGVTATLVLQGLLLLAVQGGAEADVSGALEGYFNQAGSLSGHKLASDSILDISGRLLKALQMKDAMAKLMDGPLRYLDRGDPSKPPATGRDGQGAGQLMLHKRVFCNGFTGCGGRFRGRRRQYQQQQQQQKKNIQKRMLLMMKRPFCNTHGCYNGRKRDVEIATKLHDDQATIGHHDIKTNDLADPDDEEEEEEEVSMEDSKPNIPTSFVKRLFCNGYGGCMSSGKRSRLFPNVPPRDVIGGLPEGFNGVRLQVKPKRFFAAQYDLSAQQFADDMSG